MKYLLVLWVVIIGVLSGFLIFPSLALAQDCTNPSSITDSVSCVRSKIATPGGLNTVLKPATLLEAIIKWLLSLVAILALLALVVGGIMYIVSFGNEEMAKRAKRVILYAIIGLLVVFLSFAVMLAVQSFFK